MPPETKPAITFGTPKVVTQQPYKPNDYEHGDVGFFGALWEVGPLVMLLTMLEIAIRSSSHFGQGDGIVD